MNNQMSWGSAFRHMTKKNPQESSQERFWGSKKNSENRNYQPSFKSFLLYDVSYLATSLVCLFSLELMAFQVKHVKRKKQDGDRFLYVGIVDRKSKMELEPPPPSNYSN